MSEKLEQDKVSNNVVYNDDEYHHDELAGPEPTEEDWKSLREVADKIPASAYLVIVIEFCERFTYYGLSGPFQNYIQYPAPESYPADQAGAMGRGQQTATALTTFFQFWCYITPIIGAVVADQYLGKYRTIVLFSCFYIVGLVILTATASPAAIANGAAFPGFIVAIIIIGLGTGGIKSNVSPLVAEQYQSKSPYITTTAKGERVIVTPQATYQKIFNLFYWGINVGSLSAIATTELEKNVGFWPAYLLPTLMFAIGIVVILLGHKRYVQTPPRGSVFVEAFKLFTLSWKVKGGMEACKPSNLAADHPELAVKATWDDVFVDELKRALRACIVFCWYPIYWLCYSQMTNNLVSQASTMWTGNVPNDIMQNIDPLVLIITIPLMDRIVYPGLRRVGIPMRPIFRISLGFLFASVAMAYTAGIQQRIYDNTSEYPISAGYQIPSYVFIAFSEIFASITGLEYAYKKAPQSMKSIVMALFLFTNCIASILGFALVSVAVDPKLTWMYTGISAASFICAILVYAFHHKNDKNDVEDDAIGRTGKQAEDYNKNQATVEFEAEKSVV
ncbi:POT family-domain-containing protein [Gilbertella persicaria]|uniref:Peptide transporter ptr2 n=1 Tax=Rhizopus stolonifer TaxID=4846 RepID=A0A367J8Z0_RHIST|nr:POT family-domain-containing protein [Gilbertella persicaria]KAI8084228.1 POT family-domain-containing protein [Gilbertella persicaria]RCH86211.1 peptide transporter ptr2 [Rhizopus stolonifer]